MDVQFEESQTRVAIEELLFTLLIDVFLKYRRRLWVVSIEAVEDGFNACWSLGTFVEGVRHCEVVCVERGVCEFVLRKVY